MVDGERDRGESKRSDPGVEGAEYLDDSDWRAKHWKYRSVNGSCSSFGEGSSPPKPDDRIQQGDNSVKKSVLTVRE